MEHQKLIISLSVLIFSMIIIAYYLYKRENKQKSMSDKLHLFYHLHECEKYIMLNCKTKGIGYTYYIYETDFDMFTFTRTKLTGIEPILTINNI